MDLATTLARGTMKATAAIVATKGITVTDYDALTEAMRAEVKAGYDETVAEGMAAVEAGMPESFLRHQLNVACNLFAARALRKTGLLAP